METYRNKETIKAVKWFKHGDHPSVKEIDGPFADYYPVQMGAKGYIEQNCDFFRFIFPGDYIVETMDGIVTTLSSEDFELRFEKIQDND